MCSRDFCRLAGRLYSAGDELAAEHDRIEALAAAARVERSIRDLNASGQLGPGGRLRSERQLAQQLAAGRTTIRLVLMKLATEGMVSSEHGRGYFVTGADDGHASSASE